MPAAVLGFAARESAWHGLGNIWGPDVVPTPQEAIELAGADYTVHKLPLFTEHEGNRIALPDQMALVREPIPVDPTHRLFGTVSKNYTVIQNRDVARIMTEISQTWPVSTAGYLAPYGERFFLVLKIGQSEILGDAHDDFLAITNGSDGKTSLTALVSKVRIVCQNTWNLAHAESDIKITLPHSSTVVDDLAWASDLIFQVRSANDAVSERIAALAKIRIQAEDVDQLLKATYPEPKLPGSLKMQGRLVQDTNVLSTTVRARLLKVKDQYEARLIAVRRERNEASTLYERFNDEFPKVAQTGYAFVNAVTEREDHGIALRMGPQAKAQSALFGTRAATKMRASEVIDRYGRNQDLGELDVEVPDLAESLVTA